MRLFFLLIPLAFLLSTALAGTGVRASTPESEQRPVGDFTRVDLGGLGELNVFLGDIDSVTVEADPRIVDKTTTEVRDGTFYIGMKFGILDWWRTLGAQPPRFMVSMKQVEGLRLSGSGRIRGDGLDVGRLDLAISGSGEVLLPALTARSVNADLSGSGRYELGGRAEEQTFTLAGSGQYDARQLETMTTTVRILGSGDAHVWATGALNAEILGSGSIRYAGEPRVTQRVLGSGSIRTE